MFVRKYLGPNSAYYSFCRHESARDRKESITNKSISSIEDRAIQSPPGAFHLFESALLIPDLQATAIKSMTLLIKYGCVAIIICTQANPNTTRSRYSDAFYMRNKD